MSKFFAVEIDYSMDPTSDSREKLVEVNHGKIYKFGGEYFTTYTFSPKNVAFSHYKTGRRVVIGSSVSDAVEKGVRALTVAGIKNLKKAVSTSKEVNRI